MSILNLNPLPQSLLLAGSVSLYGGMAQAQPPAQTHPDTNPEGRAGVATLCIETRSYVDVNTKKIITPNIYIDAMPKEGINTHYVEGGPAAVKWKAFLNPTDPKRKAWLAETDIPEQAEAALKLVKKLDKDKNGIVTPEEFDKGEKGIPEDDKKTDLAFLKSLECDSLYLTQGPLNTVNPTLFPEYIVLRNRMNGEINAEKVAHAKTSDDLETERVRARRFLTATSYGLGGLGVILGAGLVIVARRSRKKDAKLIELAGLVGALQRRQKKEDKTAIPSVQAEPPTLIATPVELDAARAASANPAVVPANLPVAAQPAGGKYDDVLDFLDPDKNAPSPGVLSALEEGATEEAPAADKEDPEKNAPGGEAPLPTP